MLSLIDDFQNFFSNLLNKVSLSSIFTLFIGIVIGVLLCILVYAIIILKSLKKEDYLLENDNENNEAVKKYIESSKDEYNESVKEASAVEKINTVKALSWSLINDIAKVYYPDSKHPVYELSIEELILLTSYINHRIDDLFNSRVLKFSRKFKISQIIAIIDTKKKIEDNKIIKGAKKLKISKITKTISNVLNVINPVHWIKKFMINFTLNTGINKISNIILDIVGEETAKIYSKNVFEKDETVEKMIEELQQEIEGEKTDE